ncbi:MAG: hypothetical protein JO219_02395 [Candidatus Eremiobacteraeota bacterium]|nr:hypothetical protein [Candidatus Eremiobacteraeota bacterium]MBV8365858.1 hypothetical protein [Candidatus Eremiobacteraeota bacterium]
MQDLSAIERRRLIAMRAWRPEERSVVWRGATGRFIVALEPAALALLFALCAFGIAHLSDNKEHQGYIYFAWLFGCGAGFFFLYMVGLLLYPVRALLQTRQPIFILDGYLRTRAPDLKSDPGSSGYIAAVLPDGRVACEWPAMGERALAAEAWPAYMEFSEFGGIHSIDGRSTGILPEDFPALGVGGARPPRPKA